MGELYKSGLSDRVETTLPQYKVIETGLGKNEEGELRALYVSVSDRSAGANNGFCALSADSKLKIGEQAIEASERFIKERVDVLWGDRWSIVGRDRFQLFMNFDTPLPFPGDLMWYFETPVTADAYYSVMVYFTKKRSSNIKRATLMMKYGITITPRDDLPEDIQLI